MRAANSRKEAVKANELYVLTHPEFKAIVAARFERILAAFDSAAHSQALSVLPQREIPGLNLPGQRPAAGKQLAEASQRR